MKVKRQGWIAIVNIPNRGPISYGVYDKKQDAIDEGQMEYGKYIDAIQIEWEEEV